MDDLDQKLITLLRHHARRSVSDLAIELGVALVPKSMSAVSLPGIRYVDISGIAITSEVVLAFRKSEPSRAAKSFIALCRRAP